MKNTLALLFLFLTSFFVYGQKTDSTNTVKENITPYIYIKYTELKSKKGVKNGLATIKYSSSHHGSHLMSKGYYRDNKRIGIWDFYDSHSRKTQSFDYTNKKILLLDTTIDDRLTYHIENTTDSDLVILPRKLGSHYDFEMLIDYTSNSGVFLNSPKKKNIYSIFDIDESGKLVKFQGNIESDNFKNTKEVDINLFRDDYFQFIPAYVNGKAVKSRIVYAWQQNTD